VTFINPVGAGLLGYGVDELVGVECHAASCTRPATTCCRRPARPDEDSPIDTAFEDGRLPESDDVMRRKNGDAVPVDDVRTPVCVEAGEMVGAVLVFRDLSERRLA
jgi:PAS domain-containing protein